DPHSVPVEADGRFQPFARVGDVRNRVYDTEGPRIDRDEARVGKRDPNFAETVGSGEGWDAEALRAMHLVGSEIDTLQVVTVVVRYPQRSARGICVERLLADRDPLDDFLRAGIHADDASRLRQDDPERAHALRHAHRLAADR